MVSEQLQVNCGRLAIAARLGLEGDLLILIQVAQSSALDSADVHEHIVAAAIRLNEAEALLRVEPLHGALSHFKSSRFQFCGYVLRQFANQLLVEQSRLAVN